MSLSLELAPLVFQFLPLETLEKFPQDDPLLIFVLKNQEGSRPFKITSVHYRNITYRDVQHMGISFKNTFSAKILSSLGIEHKVTLRSLFNGFADSVCKTYRAGDFYSLSRVENLDISCYDGNFSTIDLTMLPKLRKLVVHANSAVRISPRSRTVLLNHIYLPGGSTVDGVCDVQRDVDRNVTIELNHSQRVIKLTDGCVSWKPFFDKSWCGSMELKQVSYPTKNFATLEGFSNLKILKFVKSILHSSHYWLPSLPLERLSFQGCYIKGTDLGVLPLVKKLEIRDCRMKPHKSHLPQLESVVFLDNDGFIQRYGEDEGSYEQSYSVPIPKENLRKVKSFTLTTKARHFDLSSFKELKYLKVLRSYKLKRLDGLNVDTLERVTIRHCPKLKVVFPCHVTVKFGSVVVCASK